MRFHSKHVIDLLSRLPDSLELAPVWPKRQGNPIQASVLIPIICHDDPTVLLTERTLHLKSHAGQISFPGGQSEPYDASPIETALRETYEEIGVDPRDIEVIRDLGCWPTHSRFAITPVLALLSPTQEYMPCEREVADIFEVPFSYLFASDRFQQSSKEYQGQQHTYYHFNFKDKYIWGFTAGVLQFLVEHLNPSIK